MPLPTSSKTTRSESTGPETRIVALLLLWGLLAGAPIAGAQPGASPAGSPGLDQLLKLPGDLEFDVERRGGRTRSEWIARFDEARSSLESARQALAEAQERLSRVAGRKDNWNMAPPGLPVEAAEGGGDTHRLREDVRLRRAEIERAEARLRELDIEASLAGLPPSWRGQGTDPSSGNDSVPGGSAAR
jgi:hypothetical protein